MSHFAEQGQLGEVFYAPYDVRFSPYNVVEPDILYVSRDNRIRDIFVEPEWMKTSVPEAE